MENTLSVSDASYLAFRSKYPNRKAQAACFKTALALLYAYLDTGQVPSVTEAEISRVLGDAGGRGVAGRLPELAKLGYFVPGGRKVLPPRGINMRRRRALAWTVPELQEQVLAVTTEPHVVLPFLPTEALEQMVAGLQTVAKDAQTALDGKEVPDTAMLPVEYAGLRAALEGIVENIDYLVRCAVRRVPSQPKETT